MLFFEIVKLKKNLDAIMIRVLQYFCSSSVHGKIHKQLKRISSDLHQHNPRIVDKFCVETEVVRGVTPPMLRT